MADSRVSNYETVGKFFRDDLYKETDPWQTQDDDLRPLMKCIRCGTLVNGGGLSRERHDAFHAALADLFERLTELTSIHSESGDIDASR